MRKGLLAQGLVIAALATAFLPCAAHAAAEADPCQPGNIIICNLPIPLPSKPVGYKAIMTVPAPYEHDPFTVECSGSRDGSFGYTVSDSTKVTCKMETCAPGTVKVCGYDVPTPGGTVVGQREQIPIPLSFIGPSSVAKHPSVLAWCEDTGGTPLYRIRERGGTSCSEFACPTADMAICNTFVTVQGGVDVGELKDITMPPPFVPDHFKVQCLARNDKPPVYEIMEQRSVTCKKSQ